jgi:hypothetical protein
MFKTTTDNGIATIICEDCYHKNHFRESSYLKVYKHDILDEVLGPEEIKKMCKCKGELARKEYPLEKVHAGFHKCALMKIDEVAAEGKIEGIKTVADIGVLSRVVTKLRPDGKAESMGESGSPKSPGLLRMVATGLSRAGSKRDSLPVGASTSATAGPSPETPASDTSFPEFFRKHTDPNPFGHVHMSLRVGPLVIENGVSE